MSKKAYAQWMIDAGWKKSMLGSEPMFELELEGRKLVSIPQFTKTTTDFVLVDYASVWFEDFAHVKNYIFPKHALSTASVLRRKSESFQAPGSGDSAFIARCTASLKTWALGVDEARELDKHAQDREQYGLFSFDHVAALALLGRTERLSQHQTALAEDGGRLHPMVKAEHLERAQAVAAAVAEGKNPTEWIRTRG